MLSTIHGQATHETIENPTYVVIKHIVNGTVAAATFLFEESRVEHGYGMTDLKPAYFA